MILTEKRTGERLDTDAHDTHVYTVPQELFKGRVFVMKETFDKGYDAFLIPAHMEKGGEIKPIFFWAETVDKYPRKRAIDKFGGAFFISVPIEDRDAE